VADPAIRLRRLHLDLVGLPPSPQELERFLADPSQAAYEKVVDELLARPQHAERWARHWMDVWRYADWFGRRYVPDVWNSAPQIWRWRDWIVQSLIDDVGYDQMIREMLAADELKPGDPHSNVATGLTAMITSTIQSPKKTTSSFDPSSSRSTYARIDWQAKPIPARSKITSTARCVKSNAWVESASTTKQPIHRHGSTPVETSGTAKAIAAA
jgi:hypothetical protein